MIPSDWIYVDFSLLTLVGKESAYRRILPIPSPPDVPSTVYYSFNIKYIDRPFAIDLSAPFGPAGVFTSKAFVPIGGPESLPATLKGAIWVDGAETIYKQVPSFTCCNR